ncbi:hypothetical protein [Streptomyces cavernicola]|uniref:Cell wall protein n=1 Tax=Streptomyces cavernicola TaxID=3043613 RepID=A0ABT6SIM1_9ACTN|nr:hypothetical protein [Streptomyces sp. B-S-A6]MDI3408032.1 hypothetical protein [Streptomyces sp. B-S-A6]
MSAARRSLLTTAAAASVLGALWFVPSANATADRHEERHRTERAPVAASATPRPDAAPASTASAPAGTRLAETGAVNTTPYVIGGLLFLGAGVGFVAYSARQEQLS